VGVVEEIDGSLKAAHRALGMSLARSERQWGGLYEQASQMRLVPASSLFGTLERSVRDSASELGHQVDFVATGDTRLDAHVLAS
jgi:two-component system chemotaxis sensor kinase CheA